MRKPTKRLYFDDRQKIEKMLKDGVSVIKIAEAIGVHRATIYKEMQRCEEGNYSAEEAQRTIYIIPK
ncbi:helix-turn-helix domain-containing protein [[Clostridium] aminophilum]|uniref:helix-turn-helix domain-containing protein n=1 Tax=[Clostridium] aminophilum TaxID=1526 RepID=UPI003F964BFD